MKKLFAFLTSCALLLGSIPQVVSADSQEPFDLEKANPIYKVEVVTDEYWYNGEPYYIDREVRTHEPVAIGDSIVRTYFAASALAFGGYLTAEQVREIMDPMCEGEPITEENRQMIVGLLSDPAVFIKAYEFVYWQIKNIMAESPEAEIHRVDEEKWGLEPYEDNPLKVYGKWQSENLADVADRCMAASELYDEETWQSIDFSYFYADAADSDAEESYLNAADDVLDMVAEMMRAGSGDINGSGDADLTDAVLLARAIGGTYELSTTSRREADLNGDTTVDQNDLNALLRVLAGA